MSRPIPGVQSLEYRRDGQRWQRCSRCQAERSMSALVLTPGLNAADAMYPIMVGQDLVGVLCHECVHATELHIQSLFPDRHAFPFVDDRGRLMPTPRCELGHALIYSDDGRGMVCERCDVLPREPFRDPIGDALRAEPRCARCGFNEPDCRCPEGLRDDEGQG